MSQESEWTATSATQSRCGGKDGHQSRYSDAYTTHVVLSGKWCPELGGQATCAALALSATARFHKANSLLRSRLTPSCCCVHIVHLMHLTVHHLVHSIPCEVDAQAGLGELGRDFLGWQLHRPATVTRACSGTPGSRLSVWQGLLRCAAGFARAARTAP
jgi:hypothetical protein